MESRIGPKRDDEGKEARILCLSCERETTHTILRSAEYETHFSEHSFSITSWDDYHTLECKGCQALSFRHTNRNTENLDFDPDTSRAVLLETVEVYPPRIPGRGELSHSELLPTSVQAIYREVVLAMRIDLPILAGIGMRALVESISKERGAIGRDLETRIDDLAKKGILSLDGAEILHSLRIMGNRAAHEVAPHTLDDLGTGLDVIEHAMTGLYVLPQRTTKLPRRSSQPNTGTPPATS